MAEYIVQIDHPELCVEYDGSNFTEGLERIVRCRDCKHYEYMGITQGWINVCTRGGHMMLVMSDGFCAWGEPR